MQIGEINGLIAGEFENQYTPGAIQTTYSLLMRPDGLHADTNNSGFIDNQEEIDRIREKMKNKEGLMLIN